MVTKSPAPARVPLTAIRAVVWTYVAIALGTIAVLALLSAVAPHQATQEAWVHAVIVAVFAVVLPLRLRAARAGSVGGPRGGGGAARGRADLGSPVPGQRRGGDAAGPVPAVDARPDDRYRRPHARRGAAGR